LLGAEAFTVPRLDLDADEPLPSRRSAQRRTRARRDLPGRTGELAEAGAVSSRDSSASLVASLDGLADDITEALELRRRHSS
jgi:hypothetical protein